ncbi:nucleolar complex protein 14 [Pycnococcus provasolii]
MAPARSKASASKSSSKAKPSSPGSGSGGYGGSTSVFGNLHKSSSMPSRFNALGRVRSGGVAKKKKSSSSAASNKVTSAQRERKKALLIDYRALKQESTFVDRRLSSGGGGGGGGYHARTKASERTRAAFAMHGDDDDGDNQRDDYELTHMGKPLRGEAAFADAVHADDDDDAMLDAEWTRTMNFGGGGRADGDDDGGGLFIRKQRASHEEDEDGGGDDDDRPKSKKEAMRELIAKSKFYRAERAKQKLADTDELTRVDAVFQELGGTDALVSLVARAPPTPIVVLPRQPLDISGDVKYGEALTTLASDGRARATDRTKTDEELAEEAEAAEAKRKADAEKRMGPGGDDLDDDFGSLDDEDNDDEHDDDDEEDEEDEEDDDDDDDDEEEEEEDLSLADDETLRRAYDRKMKLVTDRLHEKLGQAKGEELLQLLSRQEEGSDSEEEDDDDEEEEEDDDDDDDDEDEEEEEDGDGDDDQQQHDDPEDENLLRAEPLPNADSIQAVPSTSAASKPKASPAVPSKRTPTSSAPLPSPLPLPQSASELEQLLHGRAAHVHAEVMLNIRDTHRSKLYADERKGMQTYFGVAAQYYARCCAQSEMDDTLVARVAEAVHSLALDVPVYAAAVACAQIDTVMQRRREAASKLASGAAASASDGWPTQQMCMAMHLFTRIFPRTDFRHEVSTRLDLLCSECLCFGLVGSARQAATGLFLAALCARASADSAAARLGAAGSGGAVKLRLASGDSEPDIDAEGGEDYAKLAKIAGVLRAPAPTDAPGSRLYPEAIAWVAQGLATASDDPVVELNARLPPTRWVWRVRPTGGWSSDATAAEAKAGKINATTSLDDLKPRPGAMLGEGFGFGAGKAKLIPRLRLLTGLAGVAASLSESISTPRLCACSPELLRLLATAAASASSSLARASYAPAALVAELERISEQATSWASAAESSRVPLRRKRAAAEAIKTYNPRFEESHFDGRAVGNIDPDRQRAQVKQLKRQVRREARGAARELRMDARTLASAREEDLERDKEDFRAELTASRRFMEEQRRDMASGGQMGANAHKKLKRKQR